MLSNPYGAHVDEEDSTSEVHIEEITIDEAPFQRYRSRFGAFRWSHLPKCMKFTGKDF